MDFQDLLIEKSQSKAEKNRLLENRLIAIRSKNRHEMALNIDRESHRMESVCVFRGVRFVNDSKADNTNATYYTLEQIKYPIVWIIGQCDEATNYQSLAEMAYGKVKALVCIGKNNQKIMASFNGVVPMILECEDMDTAVRQGFYAAGQGDVVLLSTGTPCKKQYQDYKEMGNCFKHAISQL